MSGTAPKSPEMTLTKRYEALLRVSQTLISIRSSEELFRLLAHELRAVVSFYVMGVGLYDEKTHEVRTTSYGEPGVPLEAPKFAPEETFSWWVYQHQQPLVIPDLDAETRFPAVAEMLKSRGVRSVCALPLTTVQRRLGGLALGSIDEDAYSSEEVSFLLLVANQVALAVDDALNLDESQQAKEALRGSEESFRVIVDSIPAFAWYASPDGKLEYLNQRIVDYTGARQEDLVGFGWANVLHPEDVERTKKAWFHSVETGEPCDVEQRVRRFDNIYRWFRTNAQPFRDRDGRVIRWYGVATDIDDSKRAEEALRASELNFRVIIDSIPGLVHTLTAAGELEFVNQQNLDYFGKTLEELKSWASSDVFHPEDLPRAIDSWKHTLESGQPAEIECRLRRADGVYRWFQLRCLPLRDSDGRIIRWMTLHTDIDERKQGEEKLKRSEASLAEAQRLTHCGSWHWNVNTRDAFWSQEMFSILGYDPERIKPALSHFLERVHPEDRLMVERVVNEEMSGLDVDLPSDYRIVLPDGTIKHLHAIAHPVTNESGKVVEIVGSSMDVTEQRLARAELESVNEELRKEILERTRADDRLQLLLDVTNQVVSNLQLRDLLRAISGNIRRVMQCDCASLALPNAEKKDLQLNVLDFPEGKGFFHEEGIYPVEGSPYGTAFRTMKPVTLESPFTAWLDNPVVQSRIHDGFKSLCFIPLIRRSRAIGTLNLGRLRGDAFTEKDIYFLGQVANQIAIAVENALEYGQITEAKTRLAEHKLYLEDEIRVEHNFEEIIGNSPRLKAVIESVRTVAPADSTVLIQGETGTGKELIARAIHNLSPRKDQAFVKLNCAAIPLGLLESELFGHERGAFTGAIAQKVGRFELAHKGTLFLDEVGDIPLELQPKLLRVLQEQEFERLGSTRTQRVDVRVLAATNVSLTQMVAEKKFRRDLYYRLNVFPIEVPPLRDRHEDIPLLVRYFANKYARRMGRKIESIPKEAMEALSHYTWPGNIRELQNLMERAVLLSTGPSLRVPLAEILSDSSRSAAGTGNALEQGEREQIPASAPRKQLGCRRCSRSGIPPWAQEDVARLQDAEVGDLSPTAVTEDWQTSQISVS
jgi:formate hydrogenlyase transcriptional activator